jgi:hypothetical protein
MFLFIDQDFNGKKCKKDPDFIRNDEFFGF